MFPSFPPTYFFTSSPPSSLLSSSSVRRCWWSSSLGTAWWRSSMTAASARGASTTPTAWWRPTSARSTSMMGVCTWAPSARRTSLNWTWARFKKRQIDGHLWLLCVPKVWSLKPWRSSLTVMSWCTRRWNKNRHRWFVRLGRRSVNTFVPEWNVSTSIWWINKKIKFNHSWSPEEESHLISWWSEWPVFRWAEGGCVVLHHHEGWVSNLRLKCVCSSGTESWHQMSGQID